MFTGPGSEVRGLRLGVRSVAVAVDGLAFKVEGHSSRNGRITVD